MLLIISETKSSAIDWDSVESFTFEAEENNSQLVINTKSGSACKVLNPTGETGEDLTFELFLNAWMCLYQSWEVREGKDKTPPPTGMPNQMPPQW
ncbi:hypothetical protein NVP1005O_24 [Vibrio phage 1.005.O._10N.286.48.F2]|nr:hypothetical protein NVP1005O_24 [Vibrio phage 1.005.O._10N.286.48.F2]